VKSQVVWIFFVPEILHFWADVAGAAANPNLKFAAAKNAGGKPNVCINRLPV